MTEKQKADFIDESDYYQSRKRKHEKEKFNSTKKILVIAGILSGLLLIITLYFLNDASRVFHVSVKGNQYYSAEKLRSLSEIEDDDIFLFISTRSIKKKLESNPLIKEATVEKKNGNLIEITVEEKKIFGYTSLDGVSYFVFTDNEKMEVEEEDVSIIARVPLVEGFDSEGLEIIAEGFDEVGTEIIEDISEIHRYPFSYDENMMELIMKDGSYWFSTYTDLTVLEKCYRQAIANAEADDGEGCYLADYEIGKETVITCPWD